MRVAFLAILLAFATPASADVKAGRQKAIQCQGCHGLDGLAKVPDAPHLAGISDVYFTKSLKSYRKGERTHEVMTIIARELTPVEIKDLADYYSAIEITATPPK